MNFVAKGLGIVIFTLFAGDTIVLEKKVCQGRMSYKSGLFFPDSLVPNEWLFISF